MLVGGDTHIGRRKETIFHEQILSILQNKNKKINPKHKFQYFIKSLNMNEYINTINTILCIAKGGWGGQQEEKGESDGLGFSVPVGAR